MKLAAFLAGFILAIPLIGRAVDQEQASGAGVLSERRAGGQVPKAAIAQGEKGAYPQLTLRSESTIPLTATHHQRKPLRWWVAKARQNKKDANKRQLTIFRLKRELRRGFIPDYWVKIASCESGVSWTYNGSSGFDGAVQFHPGTWSANRLRGYPAFAYQASPFQQLVVAEIVLSRQGWRAWPACSRKVGLR